MSVQVPKGYKQTEVGVIPKDWEVLPLRVLSERIMVGIASAATHAYRAQGVVMFRNQNIKPGFLDDSDLLFISDDYEEKFKNKRLKAFDLLTARTGYPGTTSIVPEEYEGAQSFTTLITRPKKTINHLYLCYFINSEKGQKFFEQNQIGGGQKNVNAATLKLFPVVLPSSADEQQAIAEALSDADALIESLEQLIAKKRQIKQGAMQELLTGQRRLPGFCGDWDPVTLGQLGKCLRGVSYKGSSDLFDHDNDQSKRLLRSNNVQSSSIDETDIQFVNANCVSNDQILKNNDILICMANGSKYLVGKSALFNIDDGFDYTFGAFMGCFRVFHDLAESKFVSYLMQTSSYRNQINNLLAGSSINNLTPTSIESLEFLVPSKDEQIAITLIIGEMDKEIEGFETRLSKARKIKQSMMQELLTGRIRLI